MFRFRCNECGTLIGPPNRAYPNYFFGDDKQLYRFDSRGSVQRDKRVMIGYTQEYSPRHHPAGGSFLRQVAGQAGKNLVFKRVDQLTFQEAPVNDQANLTYWLGRGTRRLVEQAEPLPALLAHVDGS